MRDTRTTDEEIAALAICALAEAVQNLLYYDDPNLSKRARTIFIQAYHPLKAAVDLFFDDAANPLVWSGTFGTPFTKQRKGKR